MEQILNLLHGLAPVTIAWFICGLISSNSGLFQQAAVTMVVIFLLDTFKKNIEVTGTLQTPCTESAPNRIVCSEHMSHDFEESNRRLVKLEMKMAKLVALVSEMNISRIRKGNVNPETTPTSSYPVAPKRNMSSGSSRSVRSHMPSEEAEYGKSWHNHQ